MKDLKNRKDNNQYIYNYYEEWENNNIQKLFISKEMTHLTFSENNNQSNIFKVIKEVEETSPEKIIAWDVIGNAQNKIFICIISQTFIKL